LEHFGSRQIGSSVSKRSGKSIVKTPIQSEPSICWDRWQSSRVIDVLAIGTHTGKCFWFGVWRSPRLNLDRPSIWDACRRSEESRGSAYRGFRGHEIFAFQIANPETPKGGRSQRGGQLSTSQKGGKLRCVGASCQPVGIRRIGNPVGI
jgi:hypothetical protein